jgi:hypothetical protein
MQSNIARPGLQRAAIERSKRHQSNIAEMAIVSCAARHRVRVGRDQLPANLAFARFGVELFTKRNKSPDHLGSSIYSIYILPLLSIILFRSSSLSFSSSSDDSVSNVCYD